MPNGTSAPETGRSSGRGSVPSIISADLRITGDLVSSGDLQVDGSIEGDVQSRTLTIGEGAHVKGAVTAETVRVCGTVTGQVKANSVTITKTAKVMGDVLHQVLGIEPGAYLEGTCKRLDAPQPGEIRGAGNAKEKKPLAGIFQGASGG